MMSTKSKNRCFLVIDEIIQEPSDESIRIRITQGSVVVIRPSDANDGELVEIHRGYQSRGIRRDQAKAPPTITNLHLQYGLPQDKVISITDREFDMLLAVDDDNKRLMLHTSGRLEWARGLEDGDAVQVELRSEQIAAVVRCSGTHQLSRSRYGLQFVVEIKDEIFERHFSDKGERRTKFLCTKNCGVFVSVDQLYQPLQLKTSATKGTTNQEINHGEAATIVEDVEVKIKPTLTMTQFSGRSLQQIVQQYDESVENRMQELKDEISTFKGEKKQLNEQVHCLKSELQEKTMLINQQQEKLSTNKAEIEKLHNILQEEIDTVRKESEKQLGDQQLQHEQVLAELQQENERTLKEQQEHHQLTEDRLQREQTELQQQVARLQQELQEMTDQKQQLQARVETAIAYMRGDPSTSPVAFDAIEPWEVPREDLHVDDSNKILGKGGWGFVAKGTFRGQKIAVKCLHQSILSQYTTNYVQHEISIMAQVRHPNLVLFIGAVLNTNTGPLIITELLDRSLRSAYEEYLLEEHCKLPILRDIAAALNYLHLHCHPIIHRDVSSANVLLEAIRSDASWKAKLSDFGSANLAHLATTSAEGPAPYAAPEVRTSKQQTPKVDVYSFGVLLCEISLCRFPPDPSGFAAFLALVRDNADPHYYELAQNCTKGKPEERPSMRDVLTQIGELIPMK